MRRLMWFTAGFSLGCGLCVAFCWEKSVLPLLLYAVVSGVLCLGFKSWNDLFRIPAAVFLGLSASLAWFTVFQTVYLNPIQKLDGAVAHLRITAVGYSEKTDYGFSVDGFAVLDGKPYRLRVYQNGNEELVPGDILESDFLLRLTTPGAGRDSPYYQGNGVFLLASQKGTSERYRSQRNDLLFLPSRVAKTAADRIMRCFPEDTAAFAKALFLGDTSDLTYEVDTALKVSGIRHVVAVSGLHVSILFGLVLLLFRGNRWLLFFASVPVLLFFAAVTGFSPSVTRACLMCGLMAFGGAVNGEYDSFTSLAFAVLCMLVWNPFVLLSVSFQLSVASVSGILMFASPIAGWFQKRFGELKGRRKRLSAWFSGSVSVSVSAMVFSTPLCAYYFGTVSLVGILTNLLTIWLIPFLFCGIAAVSLLAGVLPTVCHWLGILIAWPIRYVLCTARILSKIPFAAVYTQSGFIVAWLIVCYVLLALFLLSGKRGGKQCFAVGAFCLAGAITASILVPQKDALRLHVLDVGEGQAILLQSGKEHFLIDCGGSSPEKAADAVAQTLLSQGVRRLDGLVLTHYDQDHSNAVENLLRRMDVEQLYFPDCGAQELAARIEKTKKHSVTMIHQDYEIPFGNGVIKFLDGGKAGDDNENCMCVLFESEECVILITGDRSRSGERALLKKYALPPVDILIAGHHGANQSTSQELLQAVHPQIVIISVGTNRYGHPGQEVLDRLADYNCSVYRTDLQGSVLIRR